MRAGSALMAQASMTKLDIPSTPDLPQWLTCRPPILSIESETFNPSHLIAIHAPDAKRVLLLPVHGLLWASKAKELSILSSAPAHQPTHPILPSSSSTAPEATKGCLPVVHLQMPSSIAVPLVQSWIYNASPQTLLKLLLPPLAPVSPSLAPLVHCDILSIANELAHQPAAVLLKHINLVHSCWQDGAAIGLVEVDYWKTLARAWSVLMSALASQEAAAGTTTTTTKKQKKHQNALPQAA